MIKTLLLTVLNYTNTWKFMTTISTKFWSECLCWQTSQTLGL